MKLTVFIALGLLFVSVHGQHIKPKPFEYPNNVQVYDLPVSSNGIVYRIYIRRPLKEIEDGKKPAVFYFLDPMELFVPASTMTSNLEYFNYIPNAYYVGIGYVDDNNGFSMTENRTRDYTPTSFSPDNDSHFLSNSPKDYVGSGGADDFLKVIRNEIIPFVESNFGVDQTERVLIGKSMSGLAAVHCLLTQPDLFNNYLIVSPSIWWDDWFDARSERYVMRQAKATNKELFGRDVRVYFAVGEDEERFGLVTDLYVLVNQLKNKRIDGLKINLEVLEGEIHESVFPSAFMRGIMGLYAEKKNFRPSASKIKW